MDFIGKRKLWYAISLVILLAGLVSLIFQGLNLGIDFTGGTNLQLKFENKLDVAQVRSAFTEVGITSAQIQELDDGTYQVKIPYLENEKLIETTNSLKSKLGGLEVLSADSIGPTMGKEIFQKGLIALIVAIFLMVVYISVRFEWRFAFTGILALLHDIFATLGLFSIFQWEINSTFVAAVLTIFGYSINDTIVVFDRIRENIGQVKRENLSTVVNNSIKLSLTRSIYTSVSTLIFLISLLLFGGETTKMFVLAMTLGIAFGTYSSIFIASPIWYDISLKSKKKRF
jgi:protein-export membrane protein, secD/secF family